ncbi:methyltransferase (plasmid) [Streptosporangium sp. CA-135522]|uniref:methyltransferase n=1 Tax=Streptosporangium sp. CA-135522 TaxID=3240072 RepID=UPI003D8ECFD1
MLDAVLHFGALYTFAHLRLADLLHAAQNRTLTAEDLAEQCDVRPDLLYRILRDLTTAHIVRADTQPGAFTLTEIGATLRSDIPDSMRPAVLTAGKPAWLNAVPRLAEIVYTGRPVLPGDEDSLYGYLANYPSEATDFEAFMAARSYPIAVDLADEEELAGVRTIVDVGGGTGTILAELLRAHPHLSGVLVDGPQTAARARDRMTQLGLNDRCTVTEGDFFTEVPTVKAPPGPAVYTLCSVLHNWGDEQALQLLAEVRAAMVATGWTTQLWCVDKLLANGHGPDAGTALDLRMMSLFPHGRERTVEEYSGLLLRAGLLPKRIKPLAGLNLVIATLA